MPDPAKDARTETVLLALAFRPFFLLAGAAGAILIPLWLAVLQGWIDLGSRWAPVDWHGHEMIFGFTGAVMTGFVLTAARNWSGQPTAHGPRLGMLAALWLAARALMASGDSLPWAVGAIVGTGFFWAVAATLAPPLLRARNQRNYALIVLFFTLGIADALFHWGAAAENFPLQQAGKFLAFDLVVVLLVFMGGRVIPFFTQSVIAGPRITPQPVTDWLATGLTLGFAAVHVASFAVPALDPLAGGLALAAAAVNLKRWLAWRSLATRAMAILWVLHVGYFWLVIGLTLWGLALAFALPTTDAGIHALAAGAMGTLILGMMSRVALGHTGRPIIAPKPIIAAYGLVIFGALLRSAMAAFGPYADLARTLAGLSWAGGFAIFLVVYWAILTRPRLDGRPG